MFVLGVDVDFVDEFAPGGGPGGGCFLALVCMSTMPLSSESSESDDKSDSSGFVDFPPWWFCLRFALRLDFCLSPVESGGVDILFLSTLFVSLSNGLSNES